MNEMPAKARDYSETLFLPTTDFPMRAGLPQKEPEILARWRDIDLYGRLRAARKGRPRFILHDGPPYANGNIHAGTALNKILKDVVTRSQQMLGFDSNYVPGWDCHGLPIEWKIEEENYRAKGKPKPDLSNPSALVEFRRECRAFARHWIDVQRVEFERLGVVAEDGDRFGSAKQQSGRVPAGREHAGHPLSRLGLIPEQPEVPGRGAKLVADLAEVPKRLAYSEKGCRHGGTHDVVDNAREFSAGRFRSRRNGDHDLRRLGLTQCLHRGEHACPGGQPVIDKNDCLPGDVGRGPSAAIGGLAPDQLPTFSFGNFAQLLRRDSQPPRVHDADPGLSRRFNRKRAIAG